MPLRIGLFCSLLFCVSLSAMDIEGSETTLSGSDALKINLVTLHGYVVESDGPKLKEILEAKTNKNLNTLFVVNSQGGQFDVGSTLIGIIRKFQAKQTANRKSVVAYVGDQNDCASLCTSIFMYFQHRLLAPTAKFGYHAPNYFGLPMVDEIKQFKKMFRDAAVERKNKNFLVWLEKYPNLLEESDLTWFTGEQLISQNSGVSSQPNTFSSLDDVAKFLQTLSSL